MSETRARVLARNGNVAATHLDGRAFPGVHVQGDTFAGLLRAVTDAAGRLRRDPGDAEALDDLDHVAGEMALMLRFYEARDSRSYGEPQSSRSSEFMDG
jgi:hypothetical protein